MLRHTRSEMEIGRLGSPNANHSSSISLRSTVNRDLSAFDHDFRLVRQDHTRTSRVVLTRNHDPTGVVSLVSVGKPSTTQIWVALALPFVIPQLAN
jgi:hypothetical protein